MNSIGEHELQAYVDGELAPEDRARVSAAIEADPALRQRVERERRLHSQLRAAFDPVLDEPVPARFAALYRGDGDAAREATSGTAAPTGRARTYAANNVFPLSARDARPTRPRWHAPVYALAASLAMLAVSLWFRPQGGPVQMRDGGLVARGELARGLDNVLASAPVTGGALAIGLSFRDGEGRVCRSFVQHAQPALAGLACREGGDWALPVLSRPTGTSDGALRQAASGIPPEVQAAIDARLQGEVFDGQAERDARDAGWR